MAYPESGPITSPADAPVSANVNANAEPHITVEPDPTPGADPVASEFADSSIGREAAVSGAQSYNPGQWAGYAETPPEIEMAPAAGRKGATLATAPDGSKVSVSGSHSGMTAAGMKRSKGLFADAEAKAKEDYAPIAEQTRQFGERYAQLARDQANTVNELAALHKEHGQRMGALLQREMDFNQHQSDLELKAAADSKVVREQYLGQYQQQLAAVRQLAAQNANPLGQLGPGQALGLAAAQFAQGFLSAAYKINVDVSGQVDKWIDRELQQHQLRIQNARQDAEGTFHLYEVARQSSQDDFEARQRYRGFVLEGLKTQISQEANTFQSSLADSQAKESLAKLDTELLKTQQGLADNAQNKWLQIQQMRIGEAASQGHLAIERDKAAAEAAHYKAMEKAAGAKNTRITFMDPRNVQKDAEGNAITGGKVQWAIKEGLPKEVTDKIYERVMGAQQGYDEVAKGLDRLRMLRSKFPTTYGPEWYKKRSSPGYAVYDQQRNLVVAEIQKAMTGLAATDKEREMYLSLLQSDKWLEAGSREGARIDNMQEWARGKYDAALSDPNIEQLSDENQYYASKRNVDPSQQAADKARWQGHNVQVTPINEALQDLVARGSKEVVVNDPSKAKPGERHDSGGFSPSFWEFAKTTGAQIDTTNTYDRTPGQSRAIDAVDKLATLFARPPGDSDSTRKEALHSLRLIANGEPVLGHEQEPTTIAYAKWVLDKISGDPWANSQPEGYLRYFSSRVHPDEAADVYHRQTVDRWQQGNGPLTPPTDLLPSIIPDELRRPME
jgi:hypothetical protein